MAGEPTQNGLVNIVTKNLSPNTNWVSTLSQKTKMASLDFAALVFGIQKSQSITKYIEFIAERNYIVHLAGAFYPRRQQKGAWY